MKNIMTNVIFTCNKTQCPCKALDICHYVYLPKEGFVPKDTYKLSSPCFIYRKSANQKKATFHACKIGWYYNQFI